MVVEKEGQKWLRPYHPDEAIYGPPKMVVWDKPYIGEKPAGTKLDENQIQQTVSWAIPVGEVSYTDAEPWYPGIEYQPLFDHMSKNHGMTLTISEMDEIIALSAYILK